VATTTTTTKEEHQGASTTFDPLPSPPINKENEPFSFLSENTMKNQCVVCIV
jgi:hypothetical protein